MLRLLFTLCLTLCALAGAQTLPPDPAEPTFYEVFKVVDGDTIRINMDGKLEYVRLSGVAAPETYRRVEPLGPEATAFVRELLTGERVRLEVAEPSRDRFGRLVATVLTEDGRDVGLLLLQAGLADLTEWVRQSPYELLYIAAARGARTARKGIYADNKGRSWDADCDSFDTQDEAQSFYLGAQTQWRPDRHRLDGTPRDGVACNGLPKR